MADDFWSSQNTRDLIVGLGGSFVGFLSVPHKITLLDLFRYLVVGSLTASYCGSTVNVILNTALNVVLSRFGVSWVIPYNCSVYLTGAFGVTVFSIGMKLIERYLLKGVKND
jgi:hypothetical protein